ncbi:hypothetical protein REPUB_Repub02eG0105300 [Reevesia pubescens]
MRIWSIWAAKNELLHKEVYKHPKDVICKASVMLNEFRKANLSSNMVRSRNNNSKWLPPSVGNAKINFDAAIFNDLDAIRVGVTIRDSSSDVLALLLSKIRGFACPFLAECLALKESLNFSLEIGIRDIEVEGDSMLMVYAVKNSQVDHSIAGGIVESIKFQVPNFNKFRISHVKRG